jgi:4-alpha-glucanotransferase
MMSLAAAAGRLPVQDRRRSGVLLHPSSLLGEWYPGAFGAPARAFIDWLAAAGFTVWQMLPLGPTGAAGSPYWVRSDHAGNPRFIDSALEPEGGRAAFDDYCLRNEYWLNDYALFEALSKTFGGTAWSDWPTPLRDREPIALDAAVRQLGAQIAAIKREQWQFEDQWQQLRAYAHERGVRLFGDLPIYVAPDSVTTWTQREQFQLDPTGCPTAVAGVPPDYFAADGQLWGNPLYDWERMRSENFLFWRERLAVQLSRFDLLRIDHFRGLAAYWSVPAGEPTARNGVWREALGREMLAAVLREIPDLPVVAEDLGVITPDVDALRRDFGLSGMRVLQFAFGGNAANPHLPHNHGVDCVVYTGTHDNDTTVGWLDTLEEAARNHLQDYLGLWDGDGPDAMIRLALASVARLAVLPLQDILRLGSEARLNLPGTVGGNWRWTLPPGSLTPELARQYRELNALYARGER